MHPSEFKRRAEQFSEVLANRKGPAKIELNTPYRKAAFEGIPDGSTLKVVCTVNLPGNLPDGKTVSEFINNMVMLMMDAAMKGKYDRMEFDIPLFGERMILQLDEHGEAHYSKEKIGGGTSVN